MATRTRKVKSPVPVEINYDPDFEDLVGVPEMRDVRYVRIKVPDGRLVPDPARVLLLAAEKSPASACPVKLHTTPVFPGRGEDGVVEFKVELDVTAVTKHFGGSVEAAGVRSGTEPLPFRFFVGLEKQKESDPDNIERPGALTINLNRIGWTWQPLLFEGETHRPTAEFAYGTPIEVKVDGTDANGFCLRLVFDQRKPNGEYEPAEADFTHLLAPAEHAIDFATLTPVPKPTELTAKEGQRQIETIWRTGALRKDDPLLGKLPIETSIRVFAYPGQSIERHQTNAHPITRPPDLAPRAVREIPLRLGLRTWKVRVVTKEFGGEEPPFLLTSARPWDEGCRVEIEVLDDRGEKPEFLRYAKLKWQLRPAPGPGAAAAAPGRVLEGESGDHGDWTTDADGRVSFLFAPTRENALLFATREHFCFGAEFDVFLPDANGQPGQRLASGASGAAENAASFAFDWAPKFDLAVFKLPFFIDPAVPLDLEPEPDEETAAAIPLELAAQETEYRQLFRAGGRLSLQVEVTEVGEEPVPAFRKPLEHARLIVGGASRGGDEKRSIVAFEALGSGQAEQVFLTIPPRPGGPGGKGTLELRPEIKLHPDIRQKLIAVVQACAALDRDLAVCRQLHPTPLFNRDGATSFRQLTQDFFAGAAGYLAEADQPILCEKRKALRSTLGAMVPFLNATGETWTRLGASVEFHRNAYQRMEGALLNFYYDFILWKPINDKLAKGWEALRGRFPFLPAEFKLNSGVAQLHDKVQGALVKSGIDAIARPFLTRCAENFRKAWAERFRQLGYDLERLGAARDAGVRALANAEAKVEQQVAAAGGHVDELTALNARIESTLTQARQKGLPAEEVAELLRPLEEQHARARTALNQALAETNDAVTSLDRNAKVRLTTECEHRAVQAEKAVMEAAEQKLEAGSQELNKALQNDALPAEDLRAVLAEAQSPPVAQIANSFRDDGLQFIEQEAARRQELSQRLAAKLVELREKGNVALLAPFPGAPPAVGAGLDTASLRQRLRELETAATSQLAESKQGVAAIRQSFPARMAAPIAFYNVQKAINDELLSDAVKSGSHVGAEVLRRAVEEAPPPPASGTGLVDSFVDFLGWLIRRVLDFLIGAGKAILGTLFSLLAFLGRYLVLYPLGLLLRLTARFGAKICEALIIFFQATLGSKGAVWPTTALHDPALQAGLAELRSTREGADQFFEFPYWRETSVLNHISTAVDHLALSQEAPDRASEQFVEDTLKTGYEDYYPGQMTKARELLHGLCRRALDRATLELAPCTGETGARSVAALAAGDELGRQVGEFNTAVEAAKGGEKGFFVPLETLVGSTKWNSAALESIADWAAWIIGWTFRIGALVLAIASWWFPPGLLISTSMIAAAATVSGIGALVRFLFAACGYYPYATAYPRDLVALHAAHYAALFRAEGERLAAESASDFVKGYPK